jgi:hypothetical protein
MKKKESFNDIRKDIWVLVKHSMIDLDYGVQGSYGNGSEIFQVDVNHARKAIKLLNETYGLKLDLQDSEVK